MCVCVCECVCSRPLNLIRVLSQMSQFLFGNCCCDGDESCKFCTFHCVGVTYVQASCAYFFVVVATTMTFGGCLFTFLFALFSLLMTGDVDVDNKLGMTLS